ncbi:glutathione peroxidase [Gallaecimonas mangrovi]|uniref:glutathione peroxidase n=1 Tax=Gallaecimonas mangrovi TaxID=2291597 RepID=UPI000E1FD334|nr:glutathione peroxidase [Gallaecimonas mangrovi]
MSLTNIPFKLIDGTNTSLADFAGKVVLIVNVASKCGLTPQYEALEALYEQHRGQGLVVLGFPANNFGAQEPGSNEEIAGFCRATFGVEFPVAEKISVTGDDIHPLYQALLVAKPEAVKNDNSELLALLNQHGLAPKDANAIMWNFEKFVVNRQGEVAGRFAPDITVDDARIQNLLSEVL